MRDLRATGPRSSGRASAVTAPVIAHGVVYSTTVDNRVHAFSSAGCSAATCRPLWSDEIHPPRRVPDGHPAGLSRWAVPTAG